MATILCDFIQIVGDGLLPITSVAQPISFNTGGRISGGESGQSSALLLFNVRGLTSGEAVAVRVNSVIVGFITPYIGASPNYWYTQMISVAGNQLNNGNNQLLIQSLNDPFDIKNMVCFFHQSD